MSLVDVSPEEAEQVFNTFDPMEAPGDVRINPQHMEIYVRNMMSMDNQTVADLTRNKLSETTDLSDESIEKLSSEFARQLNEEFGDNASDLQNCTSRTRRNQIMAGIIGAVASVLAEQGVNHARTITIEIISIVASNI